MNLRYRLIAAAALTLLAAVAWPQTIEEQAIDNAYNYLAIQDYERAYSFINFVLKLHAGEDLDPDVRNLAESIYFNYLRSLADSADYVTYETVKLNLTSFPQVNSVRIQQLLQQSEARITSERQAQVEQRARDQELEAERQRLAEESRIRMQELQQEQAINEQMLEMKRLELEELARRDDALQADLQFRSETAAQDRAQQQEFNQSLLSIVAANANDSGLSSGLIVVLVVVGTVVLLGFGLMTLMFMRNSQQQREFFEYSITQTRQPREILSIPLFTAPMSDRSHMIEHRPDRALLPPVAPDLERLKGLIETCREISAEIDGRTRRRNATRNVAELVYKIATYLGYDETESMLFLAVGFVYDIGFLSIDESLFALPRLDESQFETLKAHTRLGVQRIEFIPEEYRPVFIAGILKHHENLDGSGYPDGAAAAEIPFIARAIHAAESFIAMTSEREFGEIRNKADAVAVLMQETNKYDPEVLEAIVNVV